MAADNETESANILAQFIAAPTLLEKFQLVLRLDQDASNNLQADLPGERNKLPEQLFDWLSEVLAQLLALRAQPKPSNGDLNAIYVALQRRALQLDLVIVPTNLLQFLVSIVLQESSAWSPVVYQRLHRGADRALGHLLGWLIYFKEQDNEVELHQQLVELLSDQVAPLSIASPADDLIQKWGRESPIAVYARMCAQALADAGDALAASVLCAATAIELAKEEPADSWELAGLASRHLGSSRGRDASNALLLQLGSSALSQLKGNNNHRAITLLDQAIGECNGYARGNNSLAGHPQFIQLKASLHLDRAVCRLDFDDKGYWLALEDYAQTIACIESLDGRENPASSVKRKEYLAAVLMMQLEAKRHSNTYCDQDLIQDLTRVIDLGPDTQMLLTALQKRADLRLNQSDQGTQLAQADLLRALELCIAGSKERATILTTLGCSQLALGTHSVKEPIKYFEQAIECYTAADPDDETTYELAKSWMNLGAVKMGDPDSSPESAYDAFTRSADLLEAYLAAPEPKPEATSRQFTHLLAKAQLQRGSICSALQDPARWEDGIEALSRAIALLDARFKQAPNACSVEWCDDLASAYFNRAQAWKNRRHLYQARWASDLDAAITMRRRILQSFGDAPPLQAIKRLGSVILQRSRFDYDYGNADKLPSCLQDCEEVLQLCTATAPDARQEAEFLRLQFETYELMANALAALGRDSKALSASRQAAAILQRLPLEAWSANIRLAFLSEHALRLYRASEQDAAIAVLSELADSRALLYATAQTRAGQKSFISLGQSIGVLGAWLLADAGRPREALEFVEANRGFFLREIILSDPATLAARCQIPLSRAERISDLQQKLTRLRLSSNSDDVALQDNQADSANPERLIRRNMEDLCRQLQQEIDRLDIRLALAAPAIRALAPSDGWLVIPATSALGTVVFILNQETNLEQIPYLLLPSLTSAQLAKLVQDFRSAETNLLADSVEQRDAANGEFEAALLRTSEALWQGFIDPVLNCIAAIPGAAPGAAITLVSQGGLDALPLHIASRLVDGRRRYLIEDRVIRFAPGLPALDIMQRRRQQRLAKPARLAAFINPTGDLDGAAKWEWPAIEQLDWPLAPSAWVGPDNATLEAFTDFTAAQAQAPGFTHLHLAMHGVFNSEHPEASGLVFAFDQHGNPAELATVKGIFSLPYMPELEFVCLSTCHSSLSDIDHSSDEFIGLVSAFIHAGAGSLLATLYPILDATAPAVIAGIYRRLLERQTAANSYDIAEALRDTVLEDLLDCAAPSEEERQSDSSGRQSFSLIDWAAFKPVCS
ncbi:MAG: CHAT domain-containing protein [Gammaproteobacteria bacterium]|nr:CHAT domain-containing protein [Gammaproteobacteria bacterium]